MSDVKIIVRRHGPLRITGPVVLEDAEGRVFGLGGRDTIALCRCGHSATKPFCDGGHKNAGFESDCPARDLPPPAPKPPAGS